MTVRSPGGVTFTSQRRSQRILLAVPLCVSGRHTDGSTFVERASTLIINARGGLVVLKETVVVTQTLLLKNEKYRDGDLLCGGGYRASSQRPP
jgi:hypothetical protein